MKGYEIIEALQVLLNKNDIIVSSNGNISREVFNILPKPQIYLRGSMGLPVAVGLGLALANPEKRIIVITGDGNFLMGANTILTIAHYKPQNLRVIILDNNKYFTTGGQETVSSSIDYHSLFNSLKISNSRTCKPTNKTILTELRKLIEKNTLGIYHFCIESGKLSLDNIKWHPEKITEKILGKVTEQD
jgi:thiamine pyrophosphate-dependent acetolactate synthase large subunit-like protein